MKLVVFDAIIAAVVYRVVSYVLEQMDWKDEQGRMWAASIAAAVAMFAFHLVADKTWQTH